MAGLVYVGRIVSLQAIENADKIACATVICGEGGKWKGVVRKAEFKEGDLCDVFLPDAQIPEERYSDFEFLKSSGYRVRMRKFRGAPSEVVIIAQQSQGEIGTEVSFFYGVTKFQKPLPPGRIEAEGYFPSFIPKTDEPNYQLFDSTIEKMRGYLWYCSLKYDGSSTTAFKQDGKLHVCSRNLELKDTPSNVFWQVAKKYNLERDLPEGIALQWETCGPKIQNNPLKLTEYCGFAFGAYNFFEKRYLTIHEFNSLMSTLEMPKAQFKGLFMDLGTEEISELADKAEYSPGVKAEGLVFRDITYKTHFKAINLGYER